MTEIINNSVRITVAVVFDSDICCVRVDNKVYRGQEDGGSRAVSVATQIISGVVGKCEVTVYNLSVGNASQHCGGTVGDICNCPKEVCLGCLAHGRTR